MHPRATTHRDANGVLQLNGISLAGLSRIEGVGTPTYVYDLDAMAAEARAIALAFEDAPHLVAYAVKANSAGPILRAFAAEGTGADVVSGAELGLALRCGIPAKRIIYSGVAKKDHEIDLALGNEIRTINVESVEEIHRIGARVKAVGRPARVTLRINPGVDEGVIDTHKHITTGHDDAKFGIPLSTLNDALAAVSAHEGISLVGVAAHAGSQLTAIESYLSSARKVFEIAKAIRAKAPKLELVDTGGGFGIDYGDGCPVKPADFVREVRKAKTAAGLDDLTHVVEPGRALVGAHGVLIASVIQHKVAGERHWLMIDAGMNDLLRPALYQARHRILAITVPAQTKAIQARVVGPVCESSDDFGHHALPPDGFEEVAILDCGAYGYSMASQYNGRALPAEMFLRHGKPDVIRHRKADTAFIDDRV